mmetsp:Transcript_30070/g.89360  ORF Transcript_30070/g.89360 Transcript_30070/m.89360 type:complete len:110 (+) Transcript_30070:130-459(+)
MNSPAAASEQSPLVFYNSSNLLGFPGTSSTQNPSPQCHTPHFSHSSFLLLLAALSPRLSGSSTRLPNFLYLFREKLIESRNSFLALVYVRYITGLGPSLELPIPLCPNL